MEEKREPKNDKFITGKMSDYIGKKFDVFLGRNMSIFRCDDFLFIKPPYTGVINGNFSENNYLQSKYGPLNSFFIDKKSEILSFYPINCEIEITSNNGEITLNFINNDKKSLKNTEILITHPAIEKKIDKKKKYYEFIQTTIDGKILKITNTTTIADIFKQLKIQNLMPNEIKPPNNKTDNIKNNIEETNEQTKQPNKEVLIKNEIKPDNKTDNIKNNIDETNKPTNNTSNSLFDAKCFCGFSLNDIKNNLCCCLT